MKKPLTWPNPRPAHLAAQHCAGPCQPAASSLPGRQGGDADERELATAPPACRFATGRAGRPPRHAPDPLDTSTLPLPLSLFYFLFSIFLYVCGFSKNT